MKPSWPRYLLVAETISAGPESPGWRFLLQGVDSDHGVIASDHEPNARGDRLALMAVVRGLEALDQPSRVRLVASSAYVRRGIRRGLNEWRSNGWKWERFGRLEPVRDADLWRRVDRALRFHRLTGPGLSSDGEGSPAASRNRSSVAADVSASRVISEPALLVVRGSRRHVVSVSAAATSEDKLAMAG